MLFFLHRGFRVIAHDRRGHGRSSQTSEGNDMDTYVDDLAQLTAHLDLHNAIHIGHSTGGGEVVRYVARNQDRVAKAAILSAIPPVMVKSDTNPGGTPLAVFDGFRAALEAGRADFHQVVAEGPFYGRFNRPGAKVSKAVIANWMLPGHDGRGQLRLRRMYQGVPRKPTSPKISRRSQCPSS